MKKEYLQPFLQATEKVSTMFFQSEINKSNISLEKGLDLEREVIIALGIKGSLSGIVLFGLTKEDAISLCSHVLRVQGMEPNYEWDEMAESILKEFGNQLVGYVTKLYAEGGFICDITTPSFVKSEQVANYKKESVKFEIKNDYATIVIKLHIEKK